MAADPFPHALDGESPVAEGARASQSNSLASAALDLVESLHAVIWEADAGTFRYSHVSGRAEDLLGYPVERWLQDPGFATAYVHPDDLDAVECARRDASAGECSREIEYRALTADGAVVWLREVMRADGSASGPRLRGLITDVTGRREAEAALRESEARYRSLTDDVLDSSQVGTFVLDGEFRVAWANRAACGFFGIDREDVLGRDKRRLIDERLRHVVADPDRFVSTVTATYDDNTYIERFECQILPGPGRAERWLAHWSRPVRQGHFAGGRIEHYYDVTERRASERERSWLADIVTSSSDAIFTVDLEGRFTHCNPSVERIFGYTAGELKGRHAGILAPPDRAGEAAHVMERLLRGEPIPQLDTVRRRRDGTDIEVSISVSPLHDETGSVIGCSAIVRDVTEQNRADAHIRLQAQLLDAVGQAVVATDLSGRIMYWNRAAEELYGWAAKEVLGSNIVEVTPAELSQEQAGELMERLRAGLSWTGEFPVRRKDGTSFPAMVTDTPVHDDNGTPVGIIGISWDLSEQKRVEAALRERGERLRLALEAGAFGIWDHDMAGGTVHLDERARAIIGRDGDGRVPVSEAFAVQHPEDAARVERALETAMKPGGDGLYAVEKRILRPDGETRWVSVRGKVFFEDGEDEPRAVRMLGTLADITDRRTAEDALREKDRRFHLALRAGGLGAWDLDLRTARLDCTPQCKANFGRPESARFDHEDLLEAIHPEDRPRVEADVERAIAGRTDYESEYRILLPDGSTRWISARGIPYYDANGEAVQMSGLTQDITHRRAYEDALRMAKEHAEAASEHKSQFLAVMSHELRTPLSAVIGYTDLILGGVGGPPADRHREYLDRIRMSAWHLRDLIDEVLSLSRIAAGREQVQRQDTDLNQLIRDAVTFIEPTAAEKGLALRIELPDAPVSLHTDPAKLRRIVINLTSNAVKFTSAGEVAILLAVDARDVLISVRDTGQGISPENMEKIFEPFWQEDQSNTRTSPGTGLGLAISRGLARVLGGDLIAASEPGSGSTFQVRLPRGTPADS